MGRKIESKLHKTMNYMRKVIWQAVTVFAECATLRGTRNRSQFTYYHCYYFWRILRVFSPFSPPLFSRKDPPLVSRVSEALCKAVEVNEMTFITKGNKLFHAACKAINYPGWVTWPNYRSFFIASVLGRRFPTPLSPSPTSVHCIVITFGTS